MRRFTQSGRRWPNPRSKQQVFLPKPFRWCFFRRCWISSPLRSGPPRSRQLGSPDFWIAFGGRFYPVLTSPRGPVSRGTIDSRTLSLGSSLATRTGLKMSSSPFSLIVYRLRDGYETFVSYESWSGLYFRWKFFSLQPFALWQLIHGYAIVQTSVQ